MSDDKSKPLVDTDKSVEQLQKEAALLEVQLKRAQVEQMELEKQERELNVQDLRRRLEDRKVREDQFRSDRESQGRSIAQQENTDKTRQALCTHKKGGTASARDIRVIDTGGNGNQYAVIKHQMINGDIWVRCLRCGKTWMPPVKANFYFNENGRVVPPTVGKFDEAAFKAAAEEHRRATMFETNNTMSGSVQCRFTRLNKETGNWEDAAHVVRENMQHTNLR
jgi:hypothetical protein